MTPQNTRLPVVDEDIVYAEFVDDTEQPRPAEDHSAEAGPGLGHWIIAHTLRLAARELAAFKNGTQVLKTERAAWLNASLLTPAHLRADLLNRRYANWQHNQRQEAQRLTGKANELDSRADSVQDQARGEHVTPATYKRGAAQAAAAREEAQAWLATAREVEAQPYAGHQEPTEDELEQHRRRIANRRRWCTAALGLAIGWTELQIGGILPVLTAGGIIATAWGKGRFPNWRTAAPDVEALAYPLIAGTPGTTGKNTSTSTSTGPDQAGTGEELFEGDTGKAFPIHGIAEPHVATECIRRALRAEGLPIAEVSEATSHSWGWEAVVRVSDGTPAAIAAKLDDLETRFDVGEGDVVLQPNRKRTAQATLRVITGDLFAAIKPAPYRAPGSVDITDPGTFGMSADGSDLAFSLAELMGEVIARSGGGKSTILRALLDWTTASHNAVTVFLDPSGDGPGQFKDAIRLAATDPIQIEFILLSLYRLAAGRARIRRKLGMGDSWKCTAVHPAIIVFADEFPKLTKRSKQIWAELMLVGRKEGVWIIFAAQGATKEMLGSNIAQHPALKIVGACRDVDTTAALAGGAADDGYLPHRLRPKSGEHELNHCAQTYIVGAPGLSEDPMLHKWHYIQDDEGGRRAAERLAAGLLDVDQDSIDAALNAPNPPSLKFGDPEGEYLYYVPWPQLLTMVAEPWDAEPIHETTVGAPPILAEIRKAFADAGDPEWLLTDTVLDHLATTGSQWQQWDGKEPADRRREAMKEVSRQLKKAGVDDLKTDRRKDLNKDNPPSGYWLRDVEAAIDSLAG